MNVPWRIVYTKEAVKDIKKAYAAGFKEKIGQLLVMMRENPFAPYPPYEKLAGNLTGAYSRRINHQHRLIYAVYETEKVVKIISAWTHYE